MSKISSGKMSEKQNVLNSSTTDGRWYTFIDCVGLPRLVDHETETNKKWGRRKRRRERGQHVQKHAMVVGLSACGDAKR